MNPAPTLDRAAPAAHTGQIIPLAWLHSPQSSIGASDGIIKRALQEQMAKALVAADADVIKDTKDVFIAFGPSMLWVPCVPTMPGRRAAILTLCPADRWPHDMGGPLIRRTAFRASDYPQGNPHAQPESLAPLPLWLPEQRHFTGSDTLCIAVAETPLGSPAPESLLPLPVYEPSWPAWPI